MNKEIPALWDKINDLSKRLSDFYDMLHAKSTNSINENSDGILDIADLSDENSTAITDIAEILDDITTRLEELEGKVNG